MNEPSHTWTLEHLELGLGSCAADCPTDLCGAIQLSPESQGLLTMIRGLDVEVVRIEIDITQVDLVHSLGCLRVAHG